MGTAIFTGVTGLQAFQRKLDVIANNIANVNTTGFKGARVSFGDLFSQTLEGAGAPSGNFGGTNPSQVGLGVKLASIDINHTQGSLTQTGVSSDLAIQGSGFFVLSDGSGQVFSRDGAFSLNANGELVHTATGLFVQGFPAVDGVVNSQAPVGNILVPLGGSAIVQATTSTTLTGNLSAEATEGDANAVPPIPPTTVTRTVRVFDSLGTPRDVLLTFTKIEQVTVGTDDFNAWSLDATYNGTSVINAGTSGGTRAVLLFNEDGSLNQYGFDDGSGDFQGQLGDGESVLSIGNITGETLPTLPFDLNVDFNGMSNLAGDSEVNNPNQDGFPLGVLEAYNIGESGIVNGIYSNGLTRVLGQVALATFANVGGLERLGDNLFRTSTSTGLAQIGTANTGSRGSINGGVLEGSNVDLGTEFSNMILTQRGFQANARTITTADTLLGEAVNLIR